MKTTEMKFLIPANLDIDKLFKEHAEYLKHNHINKPKMLFILDALVKSRALNRKKMNKQDTVYTPLWATMLDEVVHNYNKYLSFLVTEGILITDWFFLIGKKCRGYAFGEPYDVADLVEYTETNHMLLKAIDRQKNKYDAETNENMKGFEHLAEAWTSGKLSIDLANALEWIEADKQHKLSKLQTRKHWKRTIKKTKNAISTAIDFKNIVNNINDKNYNYRILGDGRRFYSNISNLKKGLRPFLSYDGKPLVEVDIKNSQPYLVIALFEKSFWANEENEKTARLRLKDISSKLYNKVSKKKDIYCRIITLLKTLEDEPKVDLVKFKNLVLSGLFYEYILEVFQPLYGSRFSKRSPLVKKEVLRIFYSETKLHETDPFYAPCLTFKAHFPTVYELFTLIKEVQHNLLPLILQRIESFLVLEQACKKLCGIHPGIAPFTIHDSILVVEEYKTSVEDMLRSELKHWIGYPPRLGTECKQVIDTCTGETFESEKDAAINSNLKIETLIRYLNSDDNPTCLQYLEAA